MNRTREWALVKGGEIIRVVTTSRSLPELKKTYPDYQVSDLYNLPSMIQRNYRYWEDRP